MYALQLCFCCQDQILPADIDILEIPFSVHLLLLLPGQPGSYAEQGGCVSGTIGEQWSPTYIHILYSPKTRKSQASVFTS